MNHNIPSITSGRIPTRTRIIEEILDDQSSQQVSRRSAPSAAVGRPQHSKLSVLLDRFLEICPAN